MRLIIPITPETVPHLPAMLDTLSASDPGAGHQLYILATSDCLPAAEKFATTARQKTKFGGVVVSTMHASQMSAPYSLLWTTYFRNSGPDAMWLDPEAVIIGKAGWLTRIEDSARFSTSLFLGPQSVSVTGVYRNGVSKKLRTWECSCVKGINTPAGLAGFSNLASVYRASHLLYVSDSLEGVPPLVEVVVPKTWGRPIDRQPVVKVATPEPTPEVVNEPTPEVVNEPTPEVVNEPTPEVVKVDTEVKAEVNTPQPPRVVRRPKP